MIHPCRSWQSETEPQTNKAKYYSISRPVSEVNWNHQLSASGMGKGCPFMSQEPLINSSLSTGRGLIFFPGPKPSPATEIGFWNETKFCSRKPKNFSTVFHNGVELMRCCSHASKEELVVYGPYLGWFIPSTTSYSLYLKNPYTT